MAEEQKTPFDYVRDIWNIADYVRDIIKRADYNKVILPFALLRRLECALESTREDVCKAYEEHGSEWGTENDAYCTYSKKAFYNITNFHLNSLGADDTWDALEQYINGFSANAREILIRFKMEETCKTLQEHGMLFTVCKKFAAFDLSPENVSDRDMSDIYEHLIERYGEEIAEDAEDFMTPKDIVRLAVSMLFANDIELLNEDNGALRTMCDPTCGTLGFICDALDLLDEWHKDKKLVAATKIVPYGQEVEAQSWAMGKANLLLRNVAGVGQDAADKITDLSTHIMYGDTLSDDKFTENVGNEGFDYQLSNPPYGKKWEKEQDAVLKEAKLGFAGRFGAGLPSIDDGSMLFIQHVVNHMKAAEAGGGKAGIVLSGSPLFTGDPGSGPSGIRRWLFQQDVVDCIVKLPTDIFFRTGIATYLWIFNNTKPDWRKGQIQLIDASECKAPLQKSKGNKRFFIPEDKIQWIVKTYVDGHNGGKSEMVPVEDFMFRKVTTQRPLRAVLFFNEDNKEEFFEHKYIKKLGEANIEILKGLMDKDYSDYRPTSIYANEESAEDIVTRLTGASKDEINVVQLKNLNTLIETAKQSKVAQVLAVQDRTPLFTTVWGATYLYNFAEWFSKYCRKGMTKPKATAAEIEKAIEEMFTIKNPDFKESLDLDGKVIADPELKDFENIPYTEDFDTYMNREVLPFAPDTWIDETVVDWGTGSKIIPLGDCKVGVVGTNISFNKYFYHYETPGDPDALAHEIHQMKNDIDEILGGLL